MTRSNARTSARRLLALVLILLALGTPRTASADCVYADAGRSVVCDVDTFRLLEDDADRTAAELQLCRVGLHACTSTGDTISAVLLGIVGGAAAAAGIALAIDGEWKIGGGLAVGGIAAGFASVVLSW